MSVGFEAPVPSAANPESPVRRSFEALTDRERRNPFYRWFVHLGLPLGLSLCIHGLILTGAAFYTFSVQHRPQVEVGEYEAGLMNDPADSAAQAFQWGEQVQLDAPEAQPLQDFNLQDFSRVETLDSSALQNSGGPGDAEGLGLGEGRFSLLGTGEGAAGLGEGGFGQGMGGRGGFLGQAGMWDLKVQANKIVYVVDFSGSILVAVDDLKRELKRSVGQLKPAQSFNVIVFYSEGTGTGRFKSDAFGPGLQAVTKESRQLFFDWLDKKSPRGETEPLQSMKRALTMRPEAVFFFSDGLFEDSVVEEIARANKAGGAKIYCFVFDEVLLTDMSGMPRETDGARRLRKIAEQNRGQVKVVTGKDLGRK